VVFVKYADDLTALICMRRATDDSTEDELSEIIRWAEDKKFQINWDKTLVLDCITTKSFTLNPVRTPAGDVLRNVESAMTSPGTAMWNSLSNALVAAWE